MKQVKSIVLDINKKYYSTIETKDKDTVRYLLFKLLDDGVPFDLTGKKVRAYSSSEKFNDLVTVDSKNGLCELKLTTEFLGRTGFNKVELTIYEGLNTLSTMIFCINNIACLRDDSAIESTNEFSALTIALNKVEQLEKNLEEASTDLEKKYTDRLNSIESEIKDNKLTDLETDANLTKLNSVVDGNLIVDKIQGRTLVNLSPIKPNNPYGFHMEDIENRFYAVKHVVYNNTHGFYAGKSYTFIYEQYKYDTSLFGSLVFYFEDKTAKDITINVNAPKYIEIPKNVERIELRGLRKSSQYTETGNGYRFLILEGDYTQNPPQYFEGIKSIAEDNENKIEISTCGKNLLFAQDIISKVNDPSKAWITTLDGRNVLALNKPLTDVFNNNDSNKRYTISAEMKATNIGEKSGMFAFRYTDGSYGCISTFQTSWSKVTDTSSSTKTLEAVMLLFGGAGNIVYIDIDTLQLEEGTQATPYEPYQTDKSEILLSSPLNEKDYIDKDGVHRNSLLIRLGTESWIVKDLGNGYVYAETQRYDNLIKSNTDVIACNKLPYKRTFNDMSNLTQQAICSVYTSSKLRVNLLKSNLETVDSDGINKYLKSIEVIVLLETISETIEPLNESLILSSYKDGYLGLNAGSINPIVNLRFPTNFSGRVKTLEESNIELKNNYYESLKVQLQLLAKSVELETGKLNASDLLGKIYPIGCVFTSTNGTNPGTYLGGTWAKFAEGKTLIGDSSTDSDFHAGKTGGEKEHTLINKEMPSHAHNINGCFDAGSGSIGYAECVPFGATSTPKNNDIITLDTGGGQPHNNLPPYIAVYMWTRTA